LAKTNLFQKGDFVITEHGVGNVIRNCSECEFWEVDIVGVGIRAFHYTKMDLE